MDPCNYAQLQALLDKYGFRTAKSKGQNFLVDASVPERIAQAACDGASGVVEIGPGVGSMTQQLCRRSPKVVAIEKDTALAPLLAETMAGYDNLTLRWDDALKVDLPGLVQAEFPGMNCIVCANLPYYITTPVLTALLEAECFSTVTVMVQKEVAQRICAKAGTGEYGAFSLFCQYYAVPEMLFDVPPNCFLPRPKVTSCVVQLTRRSAPVCQIDDPKLFFQVVRASFNQRRKTLVNGLSGNFPPLTKEQLAQVIVSCGFAADIRGERLDIPGFAKIANAIGRLRAAE